MARDSHTHHPSSDISANLLSYSQMGTTHHPSLPTTSTDSITNRLSKLVLQSRFPVFEKNMNPQMIADFLWTSTVSPEQITTYLTQNNDLAYEVLGYYMDKYDFSNLRLDEALRRFTETFYLVGESQQLGRILEKFASKYQSQNPSSYEDVDIVILLSHALILLNTDLHNRHNRHKMPKSVFIRNCLGAIDNHSNHKKVDKVHLSSLYHSIQQSQIMLPSESRSAMTVTCSIQSKPPRSISRTSSLFRRWGIFRRKSDPSASSKSPFKSINDSDTVDALQLTQPDIIQSSPSIINPNSSVLYEGYGRRKCILKDGFKKSRHGSWRSYHMILEGSELFFYKSASNNIENSTKWKETIVIRHAMALDPHSILEYNQKQKNNDHDILKNVCMSNHIDDQLCFLLQLSTGTLYFIQVDTRNNQQSWIYWLNRMAALHSSPPLAFAIGSFHAEFILPIMPLSVSQFDEEQQKRFIKERINQIKMDIKVQMDQYVHKGGKKFKENWNFRMEYFNLESRKYQIYLKSLENQDSYLR